MTIEVIVHGATGFTGKLVTSLLAKKKIPFAISGRSKEKLDALAKSLREADGVEVESAVVDIADSKSIERALGGKKVVLACAGPFVEVGEPVLAAAARLGVCYADTTGEQKFVALAVESYGAAFAKSGACAVSSMAYEIAPGDWAADAAAKKAGGDPDEINVIYMLRTPEGGMAGATSRGTKLSMIAMTADGDPRQWVDGALVREAAAAHVRAFETPGGKKMWAFSFPSPESVVVPSHTGATTVRTFMISTRGAARTMQLGRSMFPSFVRAFRGPLERMVERSTVGPEGEARATRFDVVAEATKAGTTHRAVCSGSDPYGLTAEIQVLFAEHAIAGKLAARGVVAPSVAIAPDVAMKALAHTGITLK